MKSFAGLDRRAFLTGGIGLGALAAMNGLVGCSQPTVEGATEGTATSATTTLSAREKFEANADPIAPVNAPATWDYDTEVVIVGSGAGGVMAAMRLADAGMSVTLVEKGTRIGGASRFAMYIVNPGGNKVTDRYQYGMLGYPYDTDALLQYIHTNLYRGNEDFPLLSAIYHAGPKAVDWLIDEGGCDLDALYKSQAGAGMLYWSQDADSGEDPIEKEGWGNWFDNLQTSVLPGKGVDIHLSTEAVALVMENGRVTGVKATADGSDVYFRGSKAVLLTSGDFSNNRAMWKRYCSRSMQANYTLPGFAGNNGAAMRMALGCGADVAGWEAVGVTTCDVNWGDVDEFDVDFPQHTINSGQTVAAQPWMRIDNTGRRMPYGDAMYSPTPNTYAIFDDSWRTLIPQNFFGTRGPLYATTRTEQFQHLIDAGVVKQADTIEGLEDALGFARGTISENVAKWNAACEAGVDYDELVAYNPAWLTPIQQGPFYGVEVGGTVWAVKCGVRVNPALQVIDTNGKVIPGLYAGFHTAGGQGGEGTGITLDAMAGVTGYGQLGMSFIGGYMASDSIVENEK